jgi:hypothetical protein
MKLTEHELRYRAALERILEVIARRGDPDSEIARIAAGGLNISWQRWRASIPLLGISRPFFRREAAPKFWSRILLLLIVAQPVVPLALTLLGSPDWLVTLMMVVGAMAIGASATLAHLEFLAGTARRGER